MSEVQTNQIIVENPSSIYTLWAKMIRGKAYTKATALQRVNIMYMAGQFTEQEYLSLIEIINTVYPD